MLCQVLVRLRLPLLLLAALALLAPALGAYAQAPPPAQKLRVEHEPVAVLDPAPVPAAPASAAVRPAALDHTVFLPLVRRPSSVTIEFAASMNETTDEPITPTDRFASGLDFIFVAWRIEGLQGSQYRLDFTYADGETLAGSNRLVQTNGFRDWTGYCITTSDSCMSGRLVLPPGVYIARLFIDNQLFVEHQAVIE